MTRVPWLFEENIADDEIPYPYLRVCHSNMYRSSYCYSYNSYACSNITFNIDGFDEMIIHYSATQYTPEYTPEYQYDM